MPTQIVRWLGLLFLALLTWSCAPARTANLTWRQCSDSLREIDRKVECADMVLPEDRSVASGKSVVLPIVIVRAASPVEGLPPVFYLHGGPGGWVVADLAAALQSPKWGDLVGRTQDWIFFDQRGSGDSRPALGCGGLQLTDAGPVSEEAAAALRDCLRRYSAQGVDLSRYNSVEVVRDLEDIRAALDVKVFDVFAISYGTRIAFDLMLHAPEGLNAAVLDSAWPLEASWTGQGPSEVSAAFRQVLSLCASDPKCLQRYPNLDARLNAKLAEWLREASLDPQVGVRIGQFALWAMQSLYAAEGVQKLPAGLTRILDGDLAVLEDPSLSQGAGYAEASHMAFLCNEELPFERVAGGSATFEGDPLAQAVALTMSKYFSVCGAMPAASPSLVENAPVASRIKTLFLAAGIDPGCPHELSEAAVERFPNGNLGIAPFSTHGVTSNSSCARRAVEAFFRNPEITPDLTCLAGDPAMPTFE